MRLKLINAISNSISISDINIIIVVVSITIVTLITLVGFGGELVYRGAVEVQAQARQPSIDKDEEPE